MQVNIKIGLTLNFFYSWYISNFQTTYKKPPFIKAAIFSDIVLVSNYHGCKTEERKLIPYYFQVMLIFSD